MSPKQHALFVAAMICYAVAALLAAYVFLPRRTAFNVARQVEIVAESAAEAVPIARLRVEYGRHYQTIVRDTGVQARDVARAFSVMSIFVAAAILLAGASVVFAAAPLSDDKVTKVELVNR